MRNSKTIWIILSIFVITSGLFFSGFIDNSPIITVNKGKKLIFTDKRPIINNPNILLCVPAAYSDESGIIGHYSTGQGRKGTSDYRYTTIHLNNNTYFQQATLVRNHKPKAFDDDKLRFRRALCKKDGVFSIVHSKIPVTLTKFSKSLKEYENAWNLDMGSYSYGWYRDDTGKIHHLGISSILNKEKQTNWIIIKN